MNLISNVQQNFAFTSFKRGLCLFRLFFVNSISFECISLVEVVIVVDGAAVSLSVWHTSPMQFNSVISIGFNDDDDDAGGASDGNDNDEYDGVDDVSDDNDEDSDDVDIYEMFVAIAVVVVAGTCLFSTDISFDNAVDETASITADVAISFISKFCSFGDDDNGISFSLDIGICKIIEIHDLCFVFANII